MIPFYIWSQARDDGAQLIMGTDSIPRFFAAIHFEEQSPYPRFEFTKVDRRRELAISLQDILSLPDQPHTNMKTLLRDPGTSAVSALPAATRDSAAIGPLHLQP